MRAINQWPVRPCSENFFLPYQENVRSEGQDAGRQLVPVPADGYSITEVLPLAID
jgi:hypothetical protein